MNFHQKLFGVHVFGSTQYSPPVQSKWTRPHWNGQTIGWTWCELGLPGRERWPGQQQQQRMRLAVMNDDCDSLRWWMDGTVAGCAGRSAVPFLTGRLLSTIRRPTARAFQTRTVALFPKCILLPRRVLAHPERTGNRCITVPSQKF